MCVCVCVRACACVCVRVRVRASLSVCLSVCLSVSLSLCLSVCLSACLSVSLSLSLCLSPNLTPKPIDRFRSSSISRVFLQIYQIDFFFSFLPNPRMEGSSHEEKNWILIFSKWLQRFWSNCGVMMSSVANIKAWGPEGTSYIILKVSRKKQKKTGALWTEETRNRLKEWEIWRERKTEGSNWNKRSPKWFIWNKI